MMLLGPFAKRYGARGLQDIYCYINTCGIIEEGNYVNALKLI